MSVEPEEIHYIKSECPHCGGVIEFPEHGAGEVIDCPHCTEKIELSLPATKQAPSPSYGILVWAGFLALTAFSGPRTFPIQVVCYLLSLGACIWWFIFSRTHERRRELWRGVLGCIAFGCGSMLPLSAAYVVLLGQVHKDSPIHIAISFIFFIAAATGLIVGASYLVFKRHENKVVDS